MNSISNKCNPAIQIICADTYMHLIFAKAISKHILFNEKIVVIWTGERKVEQKFPHIFQNFDMDFISIEDPADFSFLDLDKCYSSIYQKVEHLRDYNCKIITCYDTTYSFEIIRHIFKVDWNDVAILEDGSANYIKNVSMPHVSKRIIKNIINTILGRFSINTSRYNLGGNSNINLFFTMSPENIFLINPSKQKSISITDGVKKVLQDIDFSSKDIDLTSIDSVVSLAPIYKYQRKNKKELMKFLNQIIDAYQLSSPLIKVHPRDYSTDIIDDIKNSFGTSVKISPDVPTEFLFKNLPPIKWFGAPSSAHINRHFLYPSYGDEFFISSFGTSKQFEKGQLYCLSKILKTKFLKCEIN